MYLPPRLPRGEAKELLQCMADGDKAARDKIIEHNTRLVFHIAKKYARSQDDYDELFSIGAIGLIKAADSFKPRLGFQFATYAARCITNEILMEFRRRRQRKDEVSLSAQLPGVEDCTLADLLPDDAPAVLDTVISREASTEAAVALAGLNDEERYAVMARVGMVGIYPQTQQTIAFALGLSQSHVSRLTAKALGKCAVALEGRMAT